MTDSLADLLPPRVRSFEPAGGAGGLAGGAQARYFDVGPAFEALKGVRQAGGCGGRRVCDGECFLSADSLTSRHKPPPPPGRKDA